MAKEIKGFSKRFTEKSNKEVNTLKGNKLSIETNALMQLYKNCHKIVTFQTM